MHEYMMMRLITSVLLAFAVFCPLAWYIYYRRVVTSRFSGVGLDPTRRCIQRRFIVVGGWSTLSFLGWAAAWYSISLGGATDATSSTVLLIVGLLCAVVSIGAQFMAIFAGSKLRRVLQTLARPNG